MLQINYILDKKYPQKKKPFIEKLQKMLEKYKNIIQFKSKAILALADILHLYML